MSTYTATATKQDSEPDSSHPSSPALARLATRKKRIRQCYFCGDALYTGGRKQCPAKDERCHKCGKVGHFQKACQSEERKLFAASGSTSLSLDKQRTLSTDQTLLLLSILAGAPSSLKGSVVPCSLNGLLFDSLLDTGASDNFVDKKVAESLGFKLQGGTSVVSMASEKLNAPILGQILGNLEIQGRNYFCVTLGVVPDLCSDIVLGQSFMNKHKEITSKLNGTQEGLVTQNSVRCGVATSNVKSPRLFNNLDPNVKPITTNSRRFNETDQSFTKEEVRKLLAEGIIKLSYSPGRAHVLVTKDE